MLSRACLGKLIVCSMEKWRRDRLLPEVAAVEARRADLRRRAEGIARVEQQVAARSLGARGAAAVAHQLRGRPSPRHL
jgi:hypothetical protein